MRIGDFGTVSKINSPGAQAADIFAYLSSTTFRNNNHPVYADCLDILLQNRSHAFSSWDRSALRELAEGIRMTEKTRSVDRRNFYFRRKMYHSKGLRTYALPWGLVIDKSAAEDELSIEIKKQVNEIRRRLAADGQSRSTPTILE